MSMAHSIFETTATGRFENTAAAQRVQLSPFARDVLNGLTKQGQKKLAPKYFYDALGSKLFEAITLLPEYGLTRADSRVLAAASKDLAAMCGDKCVVAELGSGTGSKTSHVLKAFDDRELKYFPIDVSADALTACAQELQSFASVRPIRGEYIEGLARVGAMRPVGARMLLLFSGSSIGNFEPAERMDFLRSVRKTMQPGDLLLLGVDLVKNIDQMIAAYDDPVGVTAAFNLNILARINTEVGANFDLKTFRHTAIWNACEQRIEMHLVSMQEQRVDFPSLNTHAIFEEGETIWTESSHKFYAEELREYAIDSGFQVVKTWTDCEWPFAETLWRA